MHFFLNELGCLLFFDSLLRGFSLSAPQHRFLFGAFAGHLFDSLASLFRAGARLFQLEGQAVRFLLSGFAGDFFLGALLGLCFRSLARFLSAELYCLDFARQTIGLFQCQSPFFFFTLAGFGFGQLPGHCLFSEFSFGFLLGS